MATSVESVTVEELAAKASLEIARRDFSDDYEDDIPDEVLIEHERDQLREINKYLLQENKRLIDEKIDQQNFNRWRVCRAEENARRMATEEEEALEAEYESYKYHKASMKK